MSRCRARSRLAGLVSGQRERATAGLTRQPEPVQAEMTSQRGEVITPS
jgi:hypothetical protein